VDRVVDQRVEVDILHGANYGVRRRAGQQPNRGPTGARILPESEADPIGRRGRGTDCRGQLCDEMASGVGWPVERGLTT
jgi:hypothetical protein